MQDYNTCYWVPTERHKGETIDFAALYIFPEDLGPIVNEAFWENQVPSLRKCNPAITPNQADRLAIALESGAPVDYMIHVFGADPWKMTHLRFGYGYTWYPSMFEGGVSVAPGLHVPDLPDYDPNSPPAKSIDITANFKAMLAVYEASKGGA